MDTSAVSVAETEPSAPMAEVNPFEFFPGIASKIAGLGGNTPGHDHNYVFHTAYFEAAPGPSRFVVQISGLRARRGTLWLRVHMLPMEEGARAVMANSDRIQLNRLIVSGGRAEIRFEGFRRMSFALYAGIQDDTDAEATGLRVWIDRLADPNDVPDIAADVRTTQFGRSATKPVVHMISAARASFADPVSQVATRRQRNEPTYRERSGQLPAIADPLAEWQQLFVLQALDRYGMLGNGAIGLGLRTESALAEAIARAGAKVVVAEPTGAAPLEPPPDEAGITRRPIPFDALPSDLVNFDFSWSVGAWDAFSSASGALRFFESTLLTLRPGGIAVHTGRYRLHAQSAPGLPIMGRADLERLLLILISRGHETAQFKIDHDAALLDADGSAGAAAIIFRKAPSVV